MSIRSTSGPDALRFLGLPGEMSERIAAFDWASTPLGAIETWPTNLRVATGILLSSGFPKVLWWGDDHIQMYNDAFARLLDSAVHPRGLGMPAQQCWAEFWPALAPMIDLVMEGKGSVYREDQLLTIYRNGRRETAYMSYNMSPVDGDGRVDGVLVIAIDVTQQHHEIERSRNLSAGLLQLFEAGPDFVAVLRGPRHVYQFVNANYKALMGDRDFIGKPVSEVVPEVADQGFFELLDGVFRTGQTFESESIPMRYRPVPGGPMVEVMLALSYQALTDPNGEIYGIFVEGHPIEAAPKHDLTAADVDAELSERETEVLRWTAAGKTASEIALILGISYRTVEFHITSAARKLDTVNRVQTVVAAIKKKLIPI